MRKFIVFAVGLLMFLSADAATTYDVGQQQTDQVMLMQHTDGSKMVVDFVYADYSVVTIATTTETEYTIYQADLPRCVPKYSTLLWSVFRLCSHRANTFKSNIYAGWCGVNSNPPSQYDRA